MTIICDVFRKGRDVQGVSMRTGRQNQISCPRSATHDFTSMKASGDQRTRSSLTSAHSRSFVYGRWQIQSRHSNGMRVLVRAHVYWIVTILAVSVSVSIVTHTPVFPWEEEGVRTANVDSWFYRPALLDNVFGRNREIVISLEIVKENRTIQHAYREREAYYKSLPTWMDRYSFLPSPNEVPSDQRVCLVHVGELRVVCAGIFALA
jgi:hypothetical protein